MKVILFCGGMGLRLHPDTEYIPKPLVQVGEKPLIWHLLKYYSYFGHNDFILCLGYKGDQIKKYFLNYDECLSNDFILSNGGRKRKLLRNDIRNWNITFVETGLNSSIGQRLKAVQKHVEDDKVFLANYSDGLSDLHLPGMVNFFTKHDKIGCLLSVRPFFVFHLISTDSKNHIKGIRVASQADLRINGGFFVFKKEIFDYIEDEEDLVTDAFNRLIKKHELVAYKYDGFWASLDTYKDKQRLDDMVSKGECTWQIWKE